MGFADMDFGSEIDLAVQRACLGCQFREIVGALASEQ
jgi:hypothetical protein